MKTKFIAFILLLTVAFTGCKKDKPVDDLPAVKSENVDSSFRVTLKINAAKADNYGLYYTEDGSSDFSKVPPVWSGSDGGSIDKDIVFKLPEDAYPTQLRCDFGIKQVQEEFVVKSVTLEYKGKKREIAGAELLKFFRPNEALCSFDPATGILKANVKDGKIQSPSLYPIEGALGAEIANLAK